MDWPSLEYKDWKSTYQTLHRWTQIVGKTRLNHEPWLNHSWASTLYVTSKGLGTSAISNGDRNFSIDFDFIRHKLSFETSDGENRELPLKNMSVADFYKQYMNTLEQLGIAANFSPRPNELPDSLAFPEDREHCSYNPEQVRDFFRALVPINNVLKAFRSRFEGKSSPVHFFWGSFDLAVTRFSGKVAPEHPGGIPHLPDRIAREAYSHEVSSCGFWPGNDVVPYAAFYSYAYPEPEGFSRETMDPLEAFYHSELREFILPYEAIRTSNSPERTLMRFLENTFRAASRLGRWNPDVLAVSPHYLECVAHAHS